MQAPPQSQASPCLNQPTGRRAGCGAARPHDRVDRRCWATPSLDQAGL